MKKIVSLILVFVLIFSVSATAVAASDECSCGITPVVHIRGFGEPLYLDADSDNAVSVFPPEGDAITGAIPDLLKALALAAVARDYEGFGTYAMSAADKMLGAMACDENGNSIYNVSVEPDDIGSAEQHKIAHYDFGSPLSEPSGNYDFLYDWRLDPVYNAKELKEYIEEVKKLTGHSEVSIVCHSQGNTIVISYLEQFGPDGIRKIAFLSPAYQGLSLMGALFAGDISVEDKGEEFAVLVKGAMGTDPAGDLIAALISALNDAGIVSGLLDFLQNILDDQFDRLLRECLVDLFGTMPGLWAFVPDEYYEDAKTAMFTDSEKYAGLIEKIDYYHYNIQSRTESIIEDAMDNGVEVTISLGYGVSTIPVPSGAAEQADMLIDTKFMSLGAICASPFGATLGEDYKQAEYCEGHNHVSADLLIDASTCAFPEITWFVKGQTHSEFGKGYSDFLDWVLLYDGQPTVHTNEAYPQFTVRTEEDILEPVEGPAPVDTRSNVHIIFASLFEIIKNSVKK